MKIQINLNEIKNLVNLKVLNFNEMRGEENFWKKLYVVVLRLTKMNLRQSSS